MFIVVPCCFLGTDVVLLLERKEEALEVDVEGRCVGAVDVGGGDVVGRLDEWSAW